MDSKPVGSRMTRSISFAVQRNTALACGASVRSASATAIPGYRCPPVPPPARKIVTGGVGVRGSDIGEVTYRQVIGAAREAPALNKHLQWSMMHSRCEECTILHHRVPMIFCFN